MTPPQTVIHGGREYLSPGINYARCLCERKEKATKPRPRRQIKRCGGLIVNETTKFLERVASPLVTGAMFSWCNCGLFGTATRSRDNLQWLSVWWDIIHPAPFSSSYKYSLSCSFRNERMVREFNPWSQSDATPSRRSCWFTFMFFRSLSVNIYLSISAQTLKGVSAA